MCNACNAPIGAEPRQTPGDYALPAREGAYNGNAYTTDQWWPSRYGAEDLLGASNELTTERTLQAIHSVTEGRIVELAQVLEQGAPTWGNSRLYHQVTLAHGSLEQIRMGQSGSRTNYFEEQVTQIYHIGTHLDGFGHVGIDGVHYNGHRYADFYTPTGVTKFGMESVRPWLSRGVFLDIAAVVGVDMLEEGFVITPDHLEQACQVHDVEIRAGDAVIFHTGYGSLWMVDNARYNNESPGLGWDAAHWLTDRRVSLVGADNWAIEVLPTEHPDTPFVLHQHFLTETGTYLLENVRTEALLGSEKSEFLFVCTPIKTKGSTGSMVAPLAVF
jgi:kynurenine formamidase